MFIKDQFQRGLFVLMCCLSFSVLGAQQASVQFTLSVTDPSTKQFHVDMHIANWTGDTLELKMPKWMPGYYQIMDYAASVGNVKALDGKTKSITISRTNGNTWKLVPRSRAVTISYDVKTERQFVATSIVDSAHAYIAPTGAFLYIPGQLKIPVSLNLQHPWRDVATGLEPVVNRKNFFTAIDFDILYDCPILMGDLVSFPSFKVKDVEHRFVAYDPGEFDQAAFMKKLQRVVEAAVAIIGDIPFKQYTFIGIGRGQGGIEHLNNTTVSFNGRGMTSPEAMNRVMNFLAHEYFHHYNVKRIRPFELGPFDYDRENKTNLLWVSEGMSVYYEYLIVKRAGLMDEKRLLANFERNINAFENSPGRLHQSLAQASYETWTTGPFGQQGKDAARSISYYDKGPIVGMFFDFAIRRATGNKQSLDDVMRYLYHTYYKKLQRGFTDAEFQLACETVAGESLKELFETVYTVRELDYKKYFGYAGLAIKTEPGQKEHERKFIIERLSNPDPLQKAILESWLGINEGMRR